MADESDIWPAFVVRHSQGLAAYINRCAHLALELDWDRGLFFDVDQRSPHLRDARRPVYTADTGECVSGPCNGSGLEVLQVVETEGNCLPERSALCRPCREVKAEGLTGVTDGKSLIWLGLEYSEILPFPAFGPVRSAASRSVQWGPRPSTGRVGRSPGRQPANFRSNRMAVPAPGSVRFFLV